jgi:hypothetical protein
MPAAPKKLLLISQGSIHADSSTMIMNALLPKIGCTEQPQMTAAISMTNNIAVPREIELQGLGIQLTSLTAKRVSER